MKISLKRKVASVAVAMGCLCIFTLGPGADAEGAARPGYVLDSSASDMLGAHSERMLVIFGAEVHLQRYFLVDMMDQSMTVATDVARGDHYQLDDRGGGKTLVVH
jgi:hypothetical protein